MTSYPFFKMAAGSHIGFDLGNMLDHPRSAIAAVSAWSSNLVLIRFIVLEILRFLANVNSCSCSL